VTIPLHPELSEEEVEYIIDCTTKYARIVV
jgi:dTDP-4-amino-4,6-dideoxygalactose transaminase